MYRPQERQDRVSGGGHAFKLIVLPTLLGLLVGALSTMWAGVAIGAAFVGATIYWSRRHPKNVVVLRVSRGELVLLPVGSGSAVFRVRLEDLDDVVLETKSVERVLDVGAGAVNIGMGPLAPTIAPTTETKRIALEPAGGPLYPITREFFGHAESLEQFAKIRSFLRSVGWTPRSERSGED